jgi:hypothetical protein
VPAPRRVLAQPQKIGPIVRVFVVHSDERLAYEQAQRAKSMARVRTKLEALERRVTNGRRAGGESRVPPAIGIIVAVRNTTLSRVFCGAKGPDQGGELCAKHRSLAAL